MKIIKENHLLIFTIFAIGTNSLDILSDFLFSLKYIFSNYQKLVNKHDLCCSIGTFWRVST